KGSVQTTHGERPILVRYDLDKVAHSVARAKVAARAPTLWKWRELLPHERDAEVVSLGEQTTPLLDCPRLGARIGVRRLWLKDESQLPTGSFKARGMAVAVAMAKAPGLRDRAAPAPRHPRGAPAPPPAPPPPPRPGAL